MGQQHPMHDCPAAGSPPRRRAPRNALGGALCALLAGAAAAQEIPDGMPADIADMLREIGPVIETARTGPAYAALHPAEPYADAVAHRDLPYGEHERQVLDVFTANVAEEESGKPILVFVHGGGFTGGAKSAEGSPYYDNISRWAAREGMVGVQLNYRLSPEARYPSGVEDLSLAVDWLRANADSYGGDPEGIVLWGHSAGASHVADYIAANAAPRIAGAVLMSGGGYDLGEEANFRAIYYGDDVSAYAALSALPRLVRADIPILVVDAALDTAEANAQAELLARALAEAGRPADHVRAPNHSHLSLAYAVGTEDVSVSGPVRDFVFDVAGER